MLTDRDLLALRLRSLLLAGSGPAGPAQVAGHFLALQGQDLPASMWALGVRCGATLTEVEQAYRDGQVVRSWPMRGTLHVVPPQDLGWMQRLTSARLLGKSAQRRQAQLGLEAHQIGKVDECVREVLAGGRVADRNALLDEVAGRGIEIRDHWRYHLIWHLAQTGTLVFGPVVNGQAMLALASEWIKDPRDLGRQEGLAELAARYVASHGPTTAGDLAWWSGLGKRQAAEALALAGDRVVQLGAADGAGGGAGFWIAPQLVDAPRPDPSGVVLLPAFDEYLLGYRDRRLALDPAHAPAVCPGNNGVFKALVAVGGVCAGTWRPVPRGALARLPQDKPIQLAVRWFDQAANRAADPAMLYQAALAYARYLGRDQVEVTATSG
jgi:hypothetical protein